MSQTAAQALELPALLGILQRFVTSPLGRWRLEEFTQQPFHALREEAEAALAEVAEAITVLHREAGRLDGTPFLSFQGLQDIRPAVSRLRIEGSVLEAQEISALLDLLDRAETARERLIGETGRNPLLAAYGEALAEFRPVLRDLSGKVLPNGELADHASPALERIRRQIEQHRKAVHRSLEKFVREHYQEGVLQEDYVTIRNGRLVVPVKTNWKSRVEGVIHSTSSTGQTVFVEPVETIDLNNGLARLIEEEQREVHRILREMTARLRPESDAIGAAVETIARLELLFAKANFGKQFRCAIPSFCGGEEARIRLLRARHPLLEDVLSGEQRKVTPLSLTLDRGSRALVISGPNAGGKTIVLKTLGLLSLMAQAGLPVPADEAVFPWFGEVLADIGDSQSISESLSTFSAHIRQIRLMLERAGKDSLVLLDELGAATDPEEGGALGVAIVDHFLSLGAFTVVSTHLPALKTYAASTEHAQNASVGFDAQTLSPNYRLVVGIPGQSAGLAMAQRFGVPEPIITRARQSLDTNARQTAALLQQLHRQVEEHEEAGKQLRKAERAFRERERELARQTETREAARLRELEQRVEQLLESFEAETRAALDKLEKTAELRKASKDARRGASKIQRELRENVRQAAAEVLGTAPEPAVSPQPLASLTVGSTVRLAGLGATTRVLRQLPDDQWEVEAGSLRMRVTTEDIAEVLPAAQPAARLPSRVTVHTTARPSQASSELNVIGKTADEARAEVDKFLDDAVLAEIERVRIVHGHGFQILRKALWQMFTNHPHVARYYQAEQREGGAGATIVEVRL